MEPATFFQRLRRTLENNKFIAIIVVVCMALTAVLGLCVNVKTLFSKDNETPINISTSGDQSPAVYSDDTEINYENSLDDLKLDSTQKKIVDPNN